MPNKKTKARPARQKRHKARAGARSLGSVLLKEWRLRERLSQQDAAERVDCDMVQFSKYERGLHKPNRPRSHRIEEVTRGHCPSKSWDEIAPAKCDLAEASAR